MHTVDLHVHSDYSDGTDSPEQLVTLAIKKGLQAFALTDHDTVEGIPALMAAAKKYPDAPEVIPGTELSVGFRDRDIHIVGLFIDSTHQEFLKMSNTMIERRKARNEEMARRFQEAGIPVTIADLTAGNPDTVVTRAHFARWLVSHGVVKSVPDAFRGYLNPEAPYYVPRTYISREEGIRIILAAGGVPILAHPLLYGLNETELRKLLTELKGYGLQGIEVKYPTYSHQDEYFVARLAREFDLLPSGGSDYHGKTKPDISLGTGRGKLAVPAEYLEALREQAVKNRKNC